MQYVMFTGHSYMS